MAGGVGSKHIASYSYRRISPAWITEEHEKTVWLRHKPTLLSDNLRHPRRMGSVLVKYRARKPFWATDSYTGDDGLPVMESREYLAQSSQAYPSYVFTGRDDER